MSAEPVHHTMHGATTQLSRIIDRPGTPVERVVPLVRRANRTAIGSLDGQVDLSGDWDSAETNAEIATDFGLAG